MRVLVTGCNGFIGSVLCARRSELGHDVLAIDNGSRGLNDVRGLPHVTYLEDDFLSTAVIDEMQHREIHAIGDERG